MIHAPCGNVLAPRGQRLLDLANRGRVFKDGVIAGTVPQAHDVDMRLDQSRHDRAAAQIDDANAGSRRRCGVHRHKPAVSNGDGGGDGVGRVHGVDSAVDQRERLFAV